MPKKRKQIYVSIIQKIFESKFKPGMKEVDFEREDIITFGKKLRVDLPKNLGDLIYSFRYRAAFPESIQSKAPQGQAWIIRSRGPSKSHYVVPVQAKGGKDRLSIIQIEQDVAVCTSKFPSLICRPVAAQFMTEDVIALFEFEHGDDGIGVSMEKHYKLVQPEEVTEDDLDLYRRRSLD